MPTVDLAEHLDQSWVYIDGHRVAEVRTDLDHFLFALTDISQDGLEKWSKPFTCCGDFFEPIFRKRLGDSCTADTGYQGNMSRFVMFSNTLSVEL